LSFEDWEIPQALFNWILDHLEHGKTILELGSGKGSTQELSAAGYKMYSLEHNKNYLYLFNSNYIYARIAEDHFYEDRTLEALPRYDLLLIDGPDSEYRNKFLSHIGYFNTNVPILIDDMDCEYVLPFGYELATRLNRKIEIQKGAVKQFGVIE
jgi:predicted O-methyltransferase YrrM